VGAFANSTGTDSVSLGANTDDGGRARTVAVGNRTISGVADGTQATDAVNLQQLQAAIAGVAGGGDPTLPSRVTALESRMTAAEQKIDDVKKIAASGTAMAMAMAQPMLLTKKMKTSCGIGAGSFKGESATAAQCAHLMAPGTVISAGGGLSGAGAGFKVSLTHSW
jgi:autotransporter adhesin